MITAHSPGASGIDAKQSALCVGCRGEKQAPIATVVTAAHNGSLGVSFALCEVCGRDLANAVGFMVIKDGGWSKLEPKKRKVR